MASTYLYSHKHSTHTQHTLHHHQHQHHVKMYVKCVYFCVYDFIFILSHSVCYVICIYMYRGVSPILCVYIHISIWWWWWFCVYVRTVPYTHILCVKWVSAKAKQMMQRKIYFFSIKRISSLYVYNSYITYKQQNIIHSHIYIEPEYVYYRGTLLIRRRDFIFNGVFFIYVYIVIYDYNVEYITHITHMFYIYI